MCLTPAGHVWEETLMRARRNKAAVAEAAMQEALDRFRSFLHQRSLRATDVREAIVAAALRREGHFCVEDLAADARAAGLNVSMATVYRALPLLIEAGIVKVTEISGEKSFYETTFGRAHHDHLVCRDCRKVIEFQFEAFEMLQREIAAKYDFQLVDHFHELIGICSTCRRGGGGDHAH